MENRTKYFRLRMTPSEFALLRELAETNGATMTNIVIEGIQLVKENSSQSAH